MAWGQELRGSPIRLAWAWGMSLCGGGLAVLALDGEAFWLTDVLLTRGFDRQAYYRGRFVAAPADNPDQRIQQDVASLVSGALSLAKGLLDAIMVSVGHRGTLLRLRVRQLEPQGGGRWALGLADAPAV